MNVDINTFITSNLFLGVPNFEKEKLWHGFLYLAEPKKGTGIKVGYTNYDMKRRDKELKDFKSPRYMWSSPNPQVLEKYVKQILVQFTSASSDKYSTEIFYNIPMRVMVRLVRLIVLYVVTKEQWIASKDKYEVLYKYFGGPPFNKIKYKGEYKSSTIDTSDGYALGTRVYVQNKEYYDGELFEGFIIGEKEIQDTKKFDDTEVYNVEFPDSNTQDEIPVSWITPMYGIDIERTIDLEKAYKECEIEINDTLKF